MRFECYEVALDLIRSLGGPVLRIQQKDKDLAVQIRKAASSVALNLKESSRRVGKDRTHLLRVAAGAASETMGALDVACAWGHVGEWEVAHSLELCDRIRAMLHRLVNGKPPRA